MQSQLILLLLLTVAALDVAYCVADVDVAVVPVPAPHVVVSLLLLSDTANKDMCLDTYWNVYWCVPKRAQENNLQQIARQSRLERDRTDNLTTAHITVLPTFTSLLFSCFENVEPL